MATYDIIVIGGGSAFAKRASGYGAKVAIVERGRSYENGLRKGAGPGGTCVNVGCVPKKIMFYAAAHREALVSDVATAAGFGYKVGDFKFDWPSLKARRDAYVAGLNNTYKKGWASAGADLIEGIASFQDGKTVKVVAPDGSEKELKATKGVLIAVGGEPTFPDIPGIELAINSDGFFDLEQQPKKVAVIGAGYIAVELAGILHALGSETHLFFRGETVLRRGFDPFIVEVLMDALKKHGPVLHANSTPESIVKDADGTMTYTWTENGEKKSESGFDCVLMAIGRKPVADLLGLDKVGVKTDSKGLIEVDEYENTNVPDIWALGDVTTTGYELTPVAIAAGRRLADRLVGGEPKARIAYELIATVVFSHPPIGCIGLTEPQARKEFGDDAITVKTARFASMIYAFNDDDKKVKTGLKLVLKGPEERVVGLHCIGPSSDEMMQGFAVAVRMGATRADFEASVAIHPTIAEEFVTFGGWGQQTVDGVAKPKLPPYLSGS
eukprot:CAMPEP_0178412894 /NCGR_PEP_ID=MMETSP0689_2-20121128/22250_1 /TAXON_ID=160604 /ORGANISM="Amphidinium massartii, Strain CS-259" /LENGTH=496 /DNA_ID=CAMNT_0020034155 /DNA_START=58 /DNA_END=1548 /DNA_ORIENTATION=+